MKLPFTLLVCSPFQPNHLNGKPQKSLYVRLKKVGWVDTTKIRINIGGGVSLHILSATNWWNTSRMFGSRSWVKSRVSKVELYLSTLEGKLAFDFLITS